MIKNIIASVPRHFKKELNRLVENATLSLLLSEETGQSFTSTYKKFNYPLIINWSVASNRELASIYYPNKTDIPEDFSVWGITKAIKRTRFHFGVFLNKELLTLSNRSELVDTIAHEFAHCVDFYINGIRAIEHSYSWAVIAKELGADISYYKYHHRLELND